METITYEYGGGLYVNLTNRCDCACVFCLRHHGNRDSILSRFPGKLNHVMHMT